jgi:Zn-dependent protease with chaperone function
MNLLAELNCIDQCLRMSDLAPIVGLLVVMSVALLAASLMVKRPKHRLMTFVSAQGMIVISIISTFALMKCSEMLSIYLYFAYAAVSSVMIFGALRFYDRVMIKRLDAKPAGAIINWVQDYVNRLTLATVYYYDSAVPKAFATGRSIFVSIGLLELLSDDELKAVLAHEAWHIRTNSKMPFLKQLSLMTFSLNKDSELEQMADNFAADIAGRGSLISARHKLDKVFN